ncbi:MAG TPA: extracellular solute-binding protein [Candidatus Bathyarchaeia archaeon]|nr:extracellular solute-binding protein [Candidatus Bathyarchaeia archaeon]
MFAADAGDPGDPVTLFYWGYDWISQDLIQDFESLHDGSDGGQVIAVVAGQSASIDTSGDPQRLLCSIAGGDPPDVVFFARHAVAEWAARGAFMCLQPFVDRDLAEHPGDAYTIHPELFYEPCWNEASYQGRLYAAPTNTDNRALYYNLDLLEKYADELIAIGCVDPDDPSKAGPPRTWDQLRQCAEILTERDAKGALTRVGFIPNYGNSWLYLYGWLNGARFVSEDGRTCELNAPEVRDALVYMTEIYDALGGAQEVNAFQVATQGGDLDPFISDKVAMKIDGNWFLRQIPDVRRDMRFGVALAPAPEGRPQFGWCGGWSYVIPKGANHPEEAWKLIKYLVSRRAFELEIAIDRQRARASGSVYIPQLYARKDVTEWAMEHYVYSDPTIEDKFKAAARVFVDSLPISQYRPASPAGMLLWSEHVRAMEAGIYKRYNTADIADNAQQALDRSTAVVQAELDRIYAPGDYPVIRWWPIVAAYAALLLGGSAFLYRYFGRRMQAHGFFRHEYHAGYLFASPWFLGFLVFGGGPILFSLIMSFCEYDVFSPPRFVGFKNYVHMFTDDPLFTKSLGNTLFMALGIPLGMTVGLGIAMLLNYEIKGMAVYRTFFYLPAIMPAVAASILWMWIFNPQQGILNALLARAGIDGPAWLLDARWAKPALILMGLWGAGGGMIVWLAGLKGIPKHLYEAAAIDGAGPVRRFWNITVPMLSPYIFFNLIMGLIGTFQIFTQAYIMTNGGPVDSTLFYAYALFNNAFRYMRMGYAAAMAWVLFAIVLALTAIQLKLAPRWVHYESDE